MCQNMFRLLIFGVIVSLPASLAENCDALGILIYEDMNCTAIYRGDNECPVRYSCDLGKSQSCFFKNQEYAVGEQIHEYFLEGSCLRNCICNQNFTFECVRSTCPLNIPDENCYYPNDLKQCCALEDQYCPELAHTCSYGDKLYREKEVFNRKESCQKCICGEDGTYVCTRMNCASQIANGAQIQKRCAPVYQSVDASVSGSKCCPDSWMCPEDIGLEGGTEIGSVDNDNSKDVCVFGSTTYNVGEYVVFNKTLTTCACVVPPLMTCTTFS